MCQKYQAGVEKAIIANKIKITGGIAHYENLQTSGYIALDDLVQAVDELLNSNG